MPFASWQTLLKLILSNTLSVKSIMTIFLTSLTMIIGALLVSTYNVSLSKINIVPTWLWGICIFCFYFLVVDMWEAKRAGKKVAIEKAREKKRHEEERVKQEELWYLNKKNRLKNLTPSEQKILREYIIIRHIHKPFKLLMV